MVESQSTLERPVSDFTQQSSQIIEEFVFKSSARIVQVAGLGMSQDRETIQLHLF